MQFCALKLDVGGLRSQHTANIAREEQLSMELVQQQADWLRAKAELNASLLDSDQQRKEGLAKDKRLR